jgi:lysophospholipase L1-like esterase
MGRKHLSLTGLALLGAGLSGCGGGGGGPTAPNGPSGPSVPTYSVNATVFYDHNRNGQLDPSEFIRVPGVDVVIGTGTGRSAAGTGQAVVTGVQEGAVTATVRTDSVPAYYQPAAPVSVTVPTSSEVRIALSLPIGDNHSALYLGYGDSITYGEGSSDRQGYLLKLQNLLGPHFGRAEVRTWGRPGTVSIEGARKTRETLGWYDPTYVLILYGTNDWHDQACQGRPPTSCYTIEALGDMIDDVKDWDSLPIVATIPPVNPNRAPASRNTWYDQLNVAIKALAQQKGVPVADMNADFKAAGNLASLFADDVHPNDAGYQILAQGWFKAITRGRAAAASASAPRFGFEIQ